jgi:hypothetical protein
MKHISLSLSPSLPPSGSPDGAHQGNLREGCFTEDCKQTYMRRFCKHITSFYQGSIRNPRGIFAREGLVNMFIGPELVLGLSF